MATIYLIRHAEPAILGTFLGQSDPPLSETGHAQAAALSRLPVEIAYVSPLLRARETASYFRSCEIFVVPELTEIDFGSWTGKSWKQIQRDWPQLARQKEQDWLGVSPPGGEKWADFCARVRLAWHRIRAGTLPAAVVAHQGVNASLASMIINDAALSFHQTYAEVTPIEYANH